MKKIFDNKIYYFLITFFPIFISCSSVDFHRFSDPDEVVFVGEAERLNLDAEMLKDQIFNIENKKIAVLPIFTLTKIPAEQIAIFERSLIQQLSKLDLAGAKFEVNNFDADEKVNRDLINFQRFLYEISISQKDLSNSLQKFSDCDWLLTMQINNWNDDVEEQLAAQIRIIDAKSSVVIWHAGDSEDIESLAERTTLMNSIIDSLVETLAEDFS